MEPVWKSRPRKDGGSLERHDLTLQIINQRLVYLLKVLIIVTIPAEEQFSYENLGKLVPVVMWLKGIWPYQD